MAAIGSIFLKLFFGIFLVSTAAAEPDINGNLFRRAKCDGSEIASPTVRGVTECALYCLRSSGCKAFSYDAGGRRGKCSLLQGSGNIPASGAEGSCYTKVDNSSTNCNGTLPVYHARDEIRDIVQIAFHICRDESGYDFAIITNKGVYVYDEYKSIWTTGPCRGPEPIQVVFPDFRDLPQAQDVDAAMFYKQIHARIFAEGKMWQWNVGLRGLYRNPSDGSFPQKIENFYQHSVPAQPEWATFRLTFRHEQHFYYKGPYYLLYDEHSKTGNRTYRRNDTIHSSFLLEDNLWRMLPDNTLAVMTVDQGHNYVAITSDWAVYTVFRIPMSWKYFTAYQGHVIF